MSRRVVDEINRMSETHRFLRGLRSYAVFRQTAFEYDRPRRAAGVEKYTFWKLVRLALDGIFCSTTKPLKLATMAGAALAMVSFLYGVYVVLWRLRAGEESLPGFAALAVGVFFSVGCNC
jgi:dolichol-phosphate mannosyltransferase